MIKLIDQDIEDNSANFLIYDIKTNIVNSLRRIMMADYKNSAFHENNIVVNKNSGLLHNEIVRHRLSLVPINTNETVKVELKIKNNTKELLNVYSDDLKIISGKVDISKGILLYKLKENQEIELTATSDINTSKIGGTIYKPIVISYFKIIKQINLSSSIPEEKVNKIKEYLKEEFELFEEEKIYKKKENFRVLGLLHTVRDRTNFIKKTIEEFNLNAGDLLLEQLRYNNTPVYSFNIESLFINPIEILSKSLSILKEQLDQFLESDMEVEEEEYFIKLFIKNGTYTVCNTLSCFLQKNEKIKFAHYNKLHPLDDFIIIQLSLYDKNDDYIEILQNTLEEINNYIENIRKFNIFN